MKKIIGSSAIVLSLLLGGCNNQKDVNVINTTDKVILFIGDGMGENHIKITEKYNNESLYFTGFTNNGYVTTYSNNNSVTDSAAAGSALATGVKYDNGEIALHNGNNIQSISEYTKSINKGVGVITTDELNGATPSAFSAHANNRYDTSDIINSQLNSNIDLLIGTGVSTYNSYKNDFINKGYCYVSMYSELNKDCQKIIAIFESIPTSNFTDTSPSLESVSEFAVDYLNKKYPDGYFLMVEGAHIDKHSHGNNALSMIAYLTEFDKAIEKVDNKLNNDNYSILVTADHETGGVSYNDNITIDNSIFTTTGHTSANVKYYYKSSNKSIIKETIIDNTDVYKICKKELDNN